MIQQFIELGQGYSDVYELCELVRTNEHRLHNAFIFHSTHNGQNVASLAVAFKPVGESKFMPIYICREGITYSQNNLPKRIALFEEAVHAVGKHTIALELKNSVVFSENVLYYQYVIGVLRLNHYIPPLQ